MPKGLRSALKNSRREIIARVESGTAPDWVADNCCVIDKYCRAAFKAPLSKHRSLRPLISELFDERDNYFTASELCEFAESRGIAFSHAEICVLPELIAAEAVLRISDILGSGAGGSAFTLSGAVRMLMSLSDLNRGELAARLWSAEPVLAAGEPDYERSDAETRAVYREFVARESKKRGKSEPDTARALIAESNARGELLGQSIVRPPRYAAPLWVCSAAVFSALLIAAAAAVLGFYALFVAPPLAAAGFIAADLLCRHAVRPRPTFRLELDSIPEGGETLVAVATLITDDGWDEITETLSRFAYATPDTRVSFCLLADHPDSKTQYAAGDGRAAEKARAVIDRLNALHGERFCLFLRERRLNRSEGRYGGFERKRGAVCELAECIAAGGSAALYGGARFIGGVKYLLTLDSDTRLSVGTVTELVSAALHPVNRARVEGGRVVSGCGVIQPAVRTSLENAYKTGFTRLISGAGGTEVYATAAYARGQTVFGEGVFCGKGLIDVSAFCAVVLGALPCGRVLSHDVLEGAMLHTLYAPETVLTDSTPKNAVSYYRREHRWIRGDVQNLYFLFRPGLRRLTRLRLLDSVLRALLPLFSAAAMCFCGFLLHGRGILLFLFSYAYLFLPFAVSALHSLFVKSPFACLHYFSRVYSELLQSLFRLIYELSASGRRAFLALNAAFLAAYRSATGRKTLEWVTAAQAERAGAGLGKYALDSAASTLLGAALLAFAQVSFARFIGLMWFVYPFAAVFLSRPLEGGGPVRARLPERQERVLRAYCADMWRFYSENVSEATNHLPPDNVQVSPVSDTAMRTSPTNIGFYLVSVLAARDMGFIGTKTLFDRLEASMETLLSLPKYRGNLYNWYDIRTKEVIGGGYVSFVDSANLTGMLIALKEGLREYIAEDERAGAVIAQAESLINGIELSAFYDRSRSLFAVGVGSDGRLDNSFYDLKMSEACMGGYIAVARGEVPKKHWRALGRPLTHSRGYIGMLSWSGTAFEYLMPRLFLPLWRESFDFESLSFAVMMQRAAGEPWGVSESGFYSFDAQMHYQYKANGLQKLAMRRCGADENVVSPYSSFLSLPICPLAAMKNLRRLANRGVYGKYGFYEALDLNGGTGVTVKSYMAHHVGMSMIAAANALSDGVFVRRFVSDGQMKCALELLQERIPVGAVVFGNSRRLREKRREYTPAAGSAAAGDLKTMLFTRGDIGFAAGSDGSVSLFYGENAVTRTDFASFRQDPAPRVVFSRSGGVFSCSPAAGAQNAFLWDAAGATYVCSSPEFSAKVRLSIAKDCGCVMISTRAEALKKYDITLSFAPVLQRVGEYLAHSAFSGLFLEAEYDRARRILYFTRRSRRDGTPALTLAVALKDALAECGFVCGSDGFSLGDTFAPERIARISVGTEAAAFKTPHCIFRALGADGGRACFLLTCGETKRECEMNIRIARGGSGEERSLRTDEVGSRMLTAILYEKAPHAAARFSLCDIRDLWRHGISGDLPITLIKVKTPALGRISDIIRAHLVLAKRFFASDTVFLIDDPDRYDRPAERTVRELIRSGGGGEYIGRKGGFFLLRRGELTPELPGALEECAAEVFDLTRFTRPLEHLAAPQGDIRICAGSRVPLPPPPGGVRSGAGYFTPEGYTEDKSLARGSVYSFVLAGRGLGSVVTAHSLGYTFFGNARERRICAFTGEKDVAANGERLVLRIDGCDYDACACAGSFSVAPGVVRYGGEINGVEYSVTVFAAHKYPVKMIRISASRAVESRFLLRPVMGESATPPHTGVECVRAEFSSGAALLFHSPFGQTFSHGFGFAGVCGGNAAAEAALLSFSGSDAIYYIGACATEQGARTVAAAADAGFYRRESAAAEAFARSLLPPFNAASGLPARDALFNTFLPYQVGACRFLARAAFYQSGGAYGFRDQLQDCVNLVFSRPELVRTHILRCCAHQYEQGDVMHWWHAGAGSVGAGVRTRCSDDLLFLPLVTADYLRVTGDGSVLGVSVPYVASPPLSAPERYELPARSGVKESVYSHCLRALGQAFRTGAHGLILMGSCDWNDAFSLVGAAGRGESVFSTLLYILAARAFAPVMRSLGDAAAADGLLARAEALAAAVEKHAFFGDRYARAFCDDGTPIGVPGGAECEIDILSQAFAALCGLRADRVSAALSAAFDVLYDKDLRITKLFAPPFAAGGSTEVGYIRGYTPGVRENGGQYTHGALWGAAGCFAAGMDARACAILACADPATRCTDKRLAALYGGEPYAVAADIYSGALGGRAGWTWYTGAAAWAHRIMLEMLFGIRLRAGKLSVFPKTSYEFRLAHPRGVLLITASEALPAGITLDGLPAVFPLALPEGEHRLAVKVDKPARGC